MTSTGSDQALRGSRLPGLPQKLGLILRGHPFFLDVQGVPARQKVTVDTGKARRCVSAVDYVIGECDRRMLNFVPVVRRGLDARVVGLLREVTGGGRRVCLRLPVNGVLPPNGFGAELVRLMEAVGTEPEVTDVVVDLQYIEPDPGFEARDIWRVLESLPRMSDWRSVILIGTVIPQTLSGFEEDRITVIQRHEWRLWHELRFGGRGGD